MSGMFDGLAEAPTQHMIMRSAEFERIDRLPRREYTEAQLRDIADRLTVMFRTPQGLQTLRIVQAWALVELGMQGGLLAAIRVGGGKTLISFLAPIVLRSWRPMLCAPANLLDKTRRERIDYAKHWHIPAFMRLCSYELLARVQHKSLLDTYQPDLIIADECDRLANKRAGVTRRIGRYLSDNPHCRFLGMTGSLTKRSIRDYAHLAKWALRHGSFLPLHEGELEEWADALDQDVKKRPHPGALLSWATPEEQALDPVEAARRGYQRRMLQTPGVVSSDGETPTVSITIRRHTIPMSHETHRAFQHLYTRFETPDGWPFADGMQLWRHARELAMGFYYRWDPRPPSDWLDARKAWCQACRAVLSASREIDTEGQVADLIKRGQLDIPEYHAWKNIEHTFTPNSVPVWLDDSVLRACMSWMQVGPGIVWVEHKAMGLALMQATRAPYYARGGVEWHSKRVIETQPSDTAIIASIASNQRGRNLQGWSRNLITSMPPNGRGFEQLIGRTHRSGQQYPCTFDILFQCDEHSRDFQRAYNDALYTWQTSNQRQKLLEAQYG